MQIRAILFDIDGTLVDSNDMHVKAWAEAFAEIGMTFELSTIHHQIGKGADLLVPALLPNLDEQKQKKLGEREAQIFKAKYLDIVRPFPSAHDLLMLADDFDQQIVLATSSSQEQLEYYLDLLDAKHLVTATTTSNDVKQTKPAPDIFAVALKKISANPEQTLVVGDTPYDVEAARKNGIGTIALRSGGFSDEELRKADPVGIYDDVAALLLDYPRSPLAW